MVDEHPSTNVDSSVNLATTSEIVVKKLSQTPQLAHSDLDSEHPISESTNYAKVEARSMRLVISPQSQPSSPVSDLRIDNTTQSALAHDESWPSVYQASKKSVNYPLISVEKFAWSPQEQGLILGAFFYGYILLQIPGARLAETIGAKWIIFAANFGSAIVSLIFPLSTQLNSIHLLMVLRGVMGCCQSAFFPAAYVLFCRWLPEKERAVLLPVMFIGSNVGSISTYIVSSYLISSSYGWPSVFYFSGIVCLCVTMLWCVFCSNCPQDNSLITDAELNYILYADTAACVDASDSTLHLGACKNDSSIMSCCNVEPNAEPGTLDKQKPQCQLLLSTSLPPVKGNCNEIIDDVKSTCGECRRRLSSATSDAVALAAASVVANRQLAIQRRKLDNMELLRKSSKKSSQLKHSSSSSSSCSSLCFVVNIDNNDIDNNDIDNNNNNENDNSNNNNNSNTNNLAANEQPVASWSKLLKSAPIWMLILSMYGNEWSNVILCYELPTYLNTALNFPIEQNGVINSLFQFTFAVASPIFSSLGAYMLTRHTLNMQKIHVRKLFQSLSTFGQLACFVIVPLCGFNRGLIILVMFVAVVFKACANAGDIMVPGDLSLQFAGTIFAFANSIGNTAGFFAPALAGYLIDKPRERDQWTSFWFISALIMGFSGFTFLMFGRTSRQDFCKRPKVFVSTPKSLISKTTTTTTTHTKETHQLDL